MQGKRDSWLAQLGGGGGGGRAETKVAAGFPVVLVISGRGEGGEENRGISFSRLRDTTAYAVSFRVLLGKEKHN